MSEKISNNWIFQTVITILLSLLTFIAAQIWCQQRDMSGRIRLLELQQVRMMERLGIADVAKSVENPGV